MNQRYYHLRDEPITRREKLELLEKTLVRKIEEYDPQRTLLTRE